MAKFYEFNPITKKLDLIGQSASDIVENDGRYLKLDQTVEQEISNGAPLFNNGLRIKAGQKLIFDA